MYTEADGAQVGRKMRHLRIEGPPGRNTLRCTRCGEGISLHDVPQDARRTRVVFRWGDQHAICAEIAPGDVVENTAQRGDRGEVVRVDRLERIATVRWYDGADTEDFRIAALKVIKKKEAV